VGRDEDVSAEARFEMWIDGSGFGNDEAETIAMHGEAADEEVASFGGGGDGVALAFDVKEFSFADQGIETFG
jgi:hypothetical protein